MSTYDPGLPTDRDKVRFLTGDTDDDFQMLSDGEIAYMLTEEGDNVVMAASRCCVAIASKFARDVNFRFSTMWQDSSDAYAHYMELSKLYASEADSDAELDIGFLASPMLQKKIDDDKVELFWYGMHDNPPTTQSE